jgi:tetratricopeptide (TPR) repeat protein
VNAGRHHLVSLGLHAVNVVLLFLLLIRMTGAVWRSAFAAALFAIHPLHVESVAWVAERKDVLSTLFWLLTLGAWLWWLDSKTAARYGVVLVLFACGLMAKPMLVTLPFTLMLLDFWPLKRATLPPLWKEKLPLFAMSAASSVATFIAQRSGGAVRSLSGLSFPARVANAATAYTGYLGKTFWPTGLACFYPHPGEVRAWPAIGSMLVLLAVTTLAVQLARRAPYFIFGWAWYLGTLVPVIGLVQVGMQSAADRYTYVPLVGVFVAIAWGLGELASRRPAFGPGAVAVSVAAVLALAALTRVQVRYWADDVSLFSHAIAVTAENCLAHNNLGLALYGQGRTELAIDHYKEAVRIKPDYAEAHNNYGVALHRLGRDAEAKEQLQLALAASPDSVAALTNMGTSLAATGHPDEAIERYTHALRLRPDYLDARKNLGLILDGLGRHDEAIANLSRALELAPGDPDTHLGLGVALAAAGRLDEAQAHFDQGLRAKPDFPEGYNAMGIALAARGRTDEAIERYEQALRLRPDYAEALNNLGLAEASLGRLPEAIERFEHAVRINPGFAQAHNNLAVSLARTNRVPEAIEHFREAVRLDPGLVQARSNLKQLEEARH